jgi:hypothetical protein
MKKLALFPLLLVIGCALTGLYGALHDQISYSISPDYFHPFKFEMFAIPESLHNRIGASLVGWRASWWMGVLIGVPVLFVGLIMPDRKTYLIRSLIAFAVVAATALVVGLAALAYASLTITATNLPNYMYPPDVIDKVAFARVGTMHNFSYLGGFVGIVVAVLFLFIARFRLSRHARRPPG